MIIWDLFLKWVVICSPMAYFGWKLLEASRQEKAIGLLWFFPMILYYLIFIAVF